MSAIISALDNHTPKQFGENGHVEYGWSNSIREKILQFSFQLVRTDENTVKNLQVVLNNLLNSLTYQYKTGTLPEREVVKGYLSVLYRIIGNTRDIIDGKGEYLLSYMMIYTWYAHYPVLSTFAFQCFVDLGDKKTHQYGSWKDIKYFCEYCKSQGEDVSHPLIQFSIKLINDQLRKDCLVVNNDYSLTAKWVPREKSSFGWLYETLACNYFPEIMATADTESRKRKAILKCKTQYRKLLSELNKKIDTTQIKQCGKQWASIDFNKVTSITTAKQKKAFLNTKNDNSVRYPDDKDRIECAEHFKSRIKAAAAGEVEMKGKRVSMADFTKTARSLIYGGSQEEKDLLNSQWRDNSSQSGALGKMIAMVDVSGSMEGDPMEVAIALGIRVAEKSALGKRVLTFSASPSWVNLEPYKDFVSMVEVVSRADWGINTNFRAALDLILNAIIENKLEPEEVQDMVLVIFSDMQMDSGDKCDKKVLYETMETLYAEAGVRVHGKPYKPPHILFWNLRSTEGFPSLSNQSNCSMMSGFSPALLNLFCEKGLDALQSCSPWGVLEQTLENERYKIMADKLESIL
jgi:Mg-chelatase subunit ChlD